MRRGEQPPHMPFSHGKDESNPGGEGCSRIASVYRLRLICFESTIGGSGDRLLAYSATRDFASS